MRYINKIELPLPFVDFREYLLTIPDIADGLPTNVAQFFMQLVIPFERIGAVAIVNETINSEGALGRTLPIIFDIELHKAVNVSADGVELWRHLEELREAKNEVFFRSVTDKCKELFR